MQRRNTFLAASAFLLTAACTFNPKVDPSKLDCKDDNGCPSGYRCVGVIVEKSGFCCNKPDEVACFSPSDAAGTGGTPGGTGGTAAGGIASGGSVATGGTTSTAGVPTTGGAMIAGGTTASGGTTSAGGTTTAGGTIASGGTTSAGGTTTAGGTTASGGTISAGGATNAATGGSTSAGGAITVTCAAATSHPDCTLLDSGVAPGNACPPNPLIFALDANCTIGLWANDNTSSGDFYQPWCNSPTLGDCNLKMTCATNSMHITGTYLGSGGAESVDGNGGWGMNLQTTYPDAGLGCQMISGAGLTGLTVDINVVTLPTGNHLYMGVYLANGNSASYYPVLAAGAQTLRIPWACFKNEKQCGSIPGPGIMNLNFSFDWFSDVGAPHTVDVTISNLGFY